MPRRCFLMKAQDECSSRFILYSLLVSSSNENLTMQSEEKQIENTSAETNVLFILLEVIEISPDVSMIKLNT